jgi:hypothetical protein
MIHSLNLDSFYLTEEQLENSPSRQDGIDKDTEANLRMYGCELIQEAGIMLGFHQVVMATGQVLLHRFYCKRSMKNFNVKVGAALLLVHIACPLARATVKMLTEWHTRQITVQLTVVCCSTCSCCAESGCYCVVGWCQARGGQGGQRPPQEAAGDGYGVC